MDTEAAAQLAQQAWTLWQSGKPAEALPKFQQSLALDPKVANTWNGLGWANLNTGKADEAEKAFRKVLELEPAHPAALNGLGQICLARRAYDEAEKFFLQAADHGATAAWFGLSRLYLLQGRYEDAQKWAQMLADAGQGSDPLSAKMLEAAKAKNLPEGLRRMIEPPAPK
jgi:Flp pilus assembly protein TadD